MILFNYSKSDIMIPIGGTKYLLKSKSKSSIITLTRGLVQSCVQVLLSGQYSNQIAVVLQPGEEHILKNPGCAIPAYNILPGKKAEELLLQVNDDENPIEVNLKPANTKEVVEMKVNVEDPKDEKNKLQKDTDPNKSRDNEPPPVENLNPDPNENSDPNLTPVVDPPIVGDALEQGNENPVSEEVTKNQNLENVVENNDEPTPDSTENPENGDQLEDNEPPVENPTPGKGKK